MIVASRLVKLSIVTDIYSTKSENGMVKPSLASHPMISTVQCVFADSLPKNPFSNGLCCHFNSCILCIIICVTKKITNCIQILYMFPEITNSIKVTLDKLENGFPLELLIVVIMNIFISHGILLLSLFLQGIQHSSLKSFKSAFYGCNHHQWHPSFFEKIWLFPD